MLNYDVKRSFGTIEYLVEGDFGLFSRPECRPMPTSYSVPTASAANQMTKSIYWHPEIDLMVESIKVLEVPAFECIMVNGNEVTATRHDKPRQITMTMLKNPKYLIRAKLFWVDSTPQHMRNVGKVLDIFRRRIERGVCGRELYLGKSRCRCGGSVSALTQPWDEYKSPLVGKTDFGIMFYDKDYVSGISYAKHVVAIDGVINYADIKNLIPMSR